MIKLSPKQRETLRFIKKFIEKKNYAPSIRQIGVKFGISKQAVFDRLTILENKGYIERDHGVARSIRVLEE